MAEPPTISTSARDSFVRRAPNQAMRSSGLGAEAMILSNSSAFMSPAGSHPALNEQLILLFADPCFVVGQTIPEKGAK